MNVRQKRKANMYNRNLDFRTVNSSKISEVNLLNLAYNEFEQVVNEIKEEEMIQVDNKIHIQSDKDETKRKLCTYVDILNDLVQVKASVDGDTILADKMNKSKSDLENMRDSDSINAARYTYQTALTMEDALLQDLGMQQDLLPKIDTLLNKMESLKHDKGVSIDTHSASIDRMAKLFKKADNILTNRIDNIMKIFITKDPVLYSKYLSSRVIVDK